MFDCILVNGDSYSAKAKIKVYSDFLESLSGTPVINIAWPGSNNQRIARSTIEKLIELKQIYKNPLVIVGWSFIRRIEVWYYKDNPLVLNRIPDRDGPSEAHKSRLVTLDVLASMNKITLEQKCLILEHSMVHKQLTDFYTMLYMFCHTVKSLGAELFCFSAAKNTDVTIASFPYVQSLRHVQWCQSQKNLHELHDFCIMDWAEHNDPDRLLPTGHLSEFGHEKFASILQGWLKNV